MQTKKTMTPLKAIRAKCLECCCDQSREVRLCPCTDCPLYVYRFGKNSTMAGHLSEEQRSRAAERMKVARQNRRLAVFP